VNRGPFQAKFSLSGKVSVVTGTLGILGRQFCAGLAEFGSDLAVVDIKPGSAELAKSLASEFGVRAMGIDCDVRSPESVRQMTRAVTDQFGRIDVLLNNAAGKSDDLDAFFAPFEEYSLDQWRQIMAVNLDGMFLVAQAVGRGMVERGQGGSIIQTASIYGEMGPDRRIYEGSNYLGRPINTPAVYCASKAGVIGLTKYLATYWAAQKIRVNTISPGGVESGQNEVFKQRYSARVPLGRMAQANEMVGAAIFLASDASSYVTGHNLLVDGGLHCW